MKPVFRLVILCALSAALATSCSPGPGEQAGATPELVQGPDGPPNTELGKPTGPSDPEATTANDQARAASQDAGFDINRLRLPEMENLPSDSELISSQPKTGSGGVIARPPSE